ncbi:hypothetical protein COX95_03090 [bacterium CG_4_10_14_0_2_um_filter_33_32]|nr:MAG: hypothetical protein AUJ93_01390 [bacterium CG2_30_33_46]PIR67293.1 MAG: hypothetical protein COU50_03955 [bacterium CG10_big_fil_rev_8_21_14_0_10_33_18]PIU76694.1 MAG: hypothetical protein COS74_02760 [bacterium CG06_land_8_20_14_3_00_33_50]PIW80764.1 MAG: hypothetical protein COZ97_04625 [bacterium CG_4_8_14_3_um_filter_33_28]PIY85224.1 MAG: hypothetical protein COY76_03335 [bacterium CG_4_10_14_0_8_um_filter_33_57]PIZ85722.1 MAG: hypothetical protein COX95_03090 [bacterium CG_4_10_1
MKQIIYLIFAIIPAVLWIYYFYKHDKGEKQPLRILILAAVFGAIAVIPAAFLEIIAIKKIIPVILPFEKVSSISSYTSFTLALILNVLFISVIEEVLKYLSVRFTVYYSKYFDEISDGIICMVAAAFGFAAAENFLYFMKFGQDVIFIRSLFTPLFHASASAIVGHYLGIAKKEKKYQKKVLLAIIFAALLHFIYNSLVIFSGMSEKLLYNFLAIVLLVFSGKWMLDRFKETERIDEELYNGKS